MDNHEHKMAKGTLYLMIAQIIFLGSGYIIHLITARIVNPEEYGRLGVILAILQILQFFLIKGIPDSLTKYISEGRDPENIYKIGFKIQTIFSLFIIIFLLLFSPFISYDILRDDNLIIYLFLITLIIPIRAFFSVITGLLNGLRDFKKVSYILNVNSISRLIFVLTFLYIGFGITGVIGGYIFSSILTLIFGLYFLRNEKIQTGINSSVKEIIIFAAPMIIFSISYLILMNLDIIFVKAFEINPSKTGYYTAARMLSSIIFSIFLGLSSTLLPSISKSISLNNIVQTKSYIHHSLRYMIMIIIPICIIGSFYSKEFISLFYPESYVFASFSLSLLLFGTFFISLFVILGTILNGVGKIKSTSIISVFLIFIFIITNYILIKKFGMNGGALSVLIVGIISFIFSAFFVYREFHIIIKLKSLLKIIVSSSIIAILSNFLKFTGITIIIWVTILLIIYFGILYLIREIDKDDINLIKGIIKL